jgi:hypothetical protein
MVSPTSSPSLLLRLLRAPTARALFVAAMVAGVGGIGVAVVDYAHEGARHPFIVDKGTLSWRATWLWALGVHIGAALLSFPGCLLLLSRRLLRAAPAVHRWLGRGVGLLVLLVLVPSGLVLAPAARGGLAGTLGFVATGAWTFAAMVQAIVTARRRDVLGHRRAIAQVVGQMSVAVTSRALLVLLGLLAATPAGAFLDDVDPELAYALALWIPVVGSAALAAVVVPRPLSPEGGRREVALDRLRLAAAR